MLPSIGEVFLIRSIAMWLPGTRHTLTILPDRRVALRPRSVAFQPSPPGRPASALPLSVLLAHSLRCSTASALSRTASWRYGPPQLRRPEPLDLFPVKLAKATHAPRPKSAVRCRYLCPDRRRRRWRSWYRPRWAVSGQSSGFVPHGSLIDAVGNPAAVDAQRLKEADLFRLGRKPGKLRVFQNVVEREQPPEHDGIIRIPAVPDVLNS